MKILITAGPTREPLDPMRFLSNRSTGKMGYALAEAAINGGLETTLISGPVSLNPPEGLAGFVKVITAAEMAEAVRQQAPYADVIVMCAAVADYRPKHYSESKIKKADGSLILELERTEDILAMLGKNKRRGQILIGFAAETGEPEAYALEKLRRKNLDWIAANRLDLPGQGAESATNAVILYGKNGEKHIISLASKRIVAEYILHLTGVLR